MAAKYVLVFRQMLQENDQFLKEFKDIHDKFQNNNNSFRELFNKKGEEFLKIVANYQQVLCGRAEMQGHATNSLSTKFWELVKQIFPEADEIGVF